MIPLSYFQSKVDEIKAAGFNPIAVGRDTRGKNMIAFGSDIETDEAYEAFIDDSFWTYWESEDEFNRQVQNSLDENEPMLVYWLENSVEHFIAERKLKHQDLQKYSIAYFLDVLPRHRSERTDWLRNFCGILHSEENADKFIAILTLLREFDEKENEIIDLLKSFK